MFTQIREINKTSKYVNLLIDLLDVDIYKIYDKQIDLLTTNKELSDNLFGVEHCDYNKYISFLLEKYGCKYSKVYGGHHEYLYIKKIPKQNANLFKDKLDKYYLGKLQSIKL